MKEIAFLATGVLIGFGLSNLFESRKSISPTNVKQILNLWQLTESQAYDIANAATQTINDKSLSEQASVMIAFQTLYPEIANQ